MKANTTQESYSYGQLIKWCYSMCVGFRHSVKTIHLCAKCCVNTFKRTVIKVA